MKRKVRKVLLFMMLMLSSVVYCASSESSKIQFTDLTGRKMTLDKPAERIFLGFYPESYLAVAGDFDKVVCMAKAEWKDFFNGQYRAYTKKFPQVKDIVDTGSIYKGSFSMETILTSKPEVAILAPFQYDILAENIGKLENAGIKVVVVDYNSQTLKKHVLSTKIIGKVIGHQKRAEKLAQEYISAIEDIKTRVSKIKDKKKVYVELGNLGPDEIGNSYGEYLWGNIIEMAGGKNIAIGKVKNYGALSPEYVLFSNPEKIFFAGSDWTNDTGNRVLVGFDVTPAETSKRIKGYTNRLGWKNITAIKNKDIYAVDHAGLRSIYDYVYAQYIGKSIYPELFEDIDPVKNLEIFYENYLPIKPVGTFMTKYKG